MLRFLMIGLDGRSVQFMLFDTIERLRELPVCLTGWFAHLLQLSTQILDFTLFLRQWLPKLGNFSLHLNEVSAGLTLVCRPSSQQLLHAFSQFCVLLFLMSHFFHVHFYLFVLDLELLFVVMGTISLYFLNLQLPKRLLGLCQLSFEVADLFVEKHVFLLRGHQLIFCAVKLFPHHFELCLLPLVGPDQRFWVIQLTRIHWFDWLRCSRAWNWLKRRIREGFEMLLRKPKILANLVRAVE